MKPRKVRFCTGQNNRATRHIAQRYGFNIIARFRYFWDKGRAGKPRSELPGRRQASAIYDFIMASRFMKLSAGLISEGWVFREMTRARFDSYLKKGRVRVLLRRGELRGVAVYPVEENEDSITMGFVDGDKIAITRLARDCMCLARAGGTEYCSVVVPTREYARLIEGAGYSKKESVGQVIFEHKGKDFRASSAGRAR
jgi:hypothetical protein